MSSSVLEDTDQDVKFSNPIASRDTEFNRASSFDDGDTGNVSRDEVLPESLDIFETVDLGAMAGKENERDRRRRVAMQRLADSSVIDPNGSFRRKWDLIQMILLTYVAFGVPYRLGFSHPVLLWSSWFWFDVVVDLYFVSDIAVSLGTAYWDDSGELVVEPADISRNYVRTWFAIDISSCFPGNYISYAMEGEGGSATRVIKLLRMLRLLKLLRLARINRLVRKYEEEFASLMTTMKLGKLIIVIIVVGHWLSCVFFFAGEINEASFDDGEYDPGLDISGNDTVGWVWRKFDPVECGPGSCYYQKYLTTFYWAVMTMTTVGYGDIVAQTTYEMVACVISMITGGFIFGMIVGALAELSKRANAGELMRQEAVSRVQMILSSGVARGAVTPELCRRIKNHCSHMLERNTSLDINAFVLDLPPTMRDQMAEAMHWIDGESNGHQVYGLLHKVPFFADVGNVACIQICAQMKILHFVPPPLIENGKLPIMLEGEIGEEMYIIIEGAKTVVLEKDGEEIGQMSSGDFFGELGALMPSQLVEQRRRRRSAWAVSETQIGMITYDDLIRFRRDNMSVNEQVVTYTNGLLESMDASTAQTTKLSLLDCHPQLRILEDKLDQLLSK